MRRWLTALTCLALSLTSACGGDDDDDDQADAAPNDDGGAADHDGGDRDGGDAQKLDAGGKPSGNDDAAMPDDGEAPTLRITPRDGAKDVSALVVIELAFDERMQADSVLDPEHFRVEVAGKNVAGERAYDADKRSATFVADAAYKAGATVEVTAEAMRDRAGNALDKPYSAQFRIGPSPKVDAHVPASDAEDVALEASIVVTFDRLMRHESLGSQSLSIVDPDDDDEALPAVHEIEDDDGRTTVTITPDEPLRESSDYRVVITTLALSQADVPLADPVEFSFTTEGVAPEIAKATPADGTEDVAIGPADLATGLPIRIEFDEAMDTTTFADNVVVFDGVRMAARLNRVSGTVGADGKRTLVFVPDEPLLEAHTYWIAIEGDGGIDGGVRDVHGNVLAEDALLSFTTETLPYVTSIQPESGATGIGTSAHLLVYFNKPINTASVAITPTVGTPQGALTITDSAGTTVGGQVQLGGALSDVIDIRRFASGAPANWDAQRRYTVELNGALPGIEITDVHGHPVFDHQIVRFTTGDGVDSAEPELSCATCTSPTDGEVLGRGAKLWVQWNEPLDASSVTSGTVKVYRQNQPNMLVPARVSYDASLRRIVLEPLSPLPAGAALTFAFTSGIKDLSGNAKAAPDNEIDFFVAQNAEPSVIAALPPQNAVGVPQNSSARFVFSEEIDPGTLEITANADSADVPGAVRYDVGSSTAVFQPALSLPADTEIMVAIADSTADLDGAQLSGGYGLLFETGSTTDSDAPAILTTAPADGATAVAATTDLEVVFDEAIDPTTISADAVALLDVDSGEYQELTTVYDPVSERLVIVPRFALAAGDTYEVTLAPAIRDLAGNPLDTAADQNVFSFAIESTPPTASSTLAGAVIGAAVQVPIVFSEDMDAYSITPDSVGLTNAAQAAVLVAIDYDPSARTLVLEPSGPLGDGVYTVHLAAAAAAPGFSLRDVGGSVLTANSGDEWTFSFTVNTAAPNVESFLPTCNSVISVDQFGTTQFVVDFDRAVTGPGAASLTGNASAFTLSGSSSGVETLTITQNATAQVTLAANNGLGNGETYTLTVVAAQIRSQSNATAMAADRVCSFTTQKILYSHDASASATPSCASQAGAANSGNSWGCRVVPTSGEASEVWHGGNTTPTGNYVRACPALLAADGATRVVTMTTPTFNLQGLTSVQASFDVSDDVNSAAGDFGRLDVLVGGVAQVPAVVTWTGQNFGALRHESYDLSAYTGQVIQLRYTLSITGGKGGLSPTCPAMRRGMLIDDILVVGN